VTKRASLSITMVRGVFGDLMSSIRNMDLNMADVARIIAVFEPTAINIASVVDNDPFWSKFVKDILRQGIIYNNPILGIRVDLHGDSAREAFLNCINGGEDDLARAAWIHISCITALLSLISSQEEARME